MNRKTLALAGSAVVLVVMLKTKKGQIRNGAVRWISVEVRYLPSLYSQVSVQCEADTAPSAASPEYFSLSVCDVFSFGQESHLVK